MTLPACGVYQTTQGLAGVPSGRLVYFHNHGDPGPGIYLPERWVLNRAVWSRRGHTLGDESMAAALAPLPDEGLYVVISSFFCCAKRCTQYHENQLVQLGYDGAATPLLFVPEMTGLGLGFPERGNRLDSSAFSKMKLLVVARAENETPGEAFIH